ncbi:hypothetical protein QCA50_002373 [Cerrena zonata]|uniref:Uncharacterized protein n=1 Tax=Cerrena zonata TaxID=2478898 RepID=A0AAW0GP62_9APHY
MTGRGKGGTAGKHITQSDGKDGGRGFRIRNGQDLDQSRSMLIEDIGKKLWHRVEEQGVVPRENGFRVCGEAKIVTRGMCVQEDVGEQG